jgi:serine protease
MIVSWPGPSTRLGRVLLPIVVTAGLIAAPAARAAGSPGDARTPAAYAPGQVLVHYRGAPGERALRLPAGVTVPDALARLRADPRVGYANPNYLVRAAARCPRPHNPSHGGPDCWRDDQWNFLSPSLVPGGVDAEGAWRNLIASDRAGGRGITVAVIDTGVAYRQDGRRFRRDPDLPPVRRFVAPRDFVGGDRLPLDEDGHGTHVASIVAQATNNHKGLTGLAYGVKVMPVRVLNSEEKGTGEEVARGIRYAAKHGADVINLSLEFQPTVRKCRQIAGVCRAVKEAAAEGIVVVAAAGNRARARVAFPAAAPGVIAVGATTWRGCLARYSDYGAGLDLVAPGGGLDRANAGSTCDPTAGGPTIRQFSLEAHAASAGFRRFGILGMHGTSMSAAHVSAVAALLRAEGVPPDQVETRLECTTTRPEGDDPTHYGAGLLDAASATAGHCT